MKIFLVFVFRTAATTTHCRYIYLNLEIWFTYVDKPHLYFVQKKFTDSCLLSLSNKVYFAHTQLLDCCNKLHMTTYRICSLVKRKYLTIIYLTVMCLFRYKVLNILEIERSCLNLDSWKCFYLHISTDKYIHKKIEYNVRCLNDV